LRESVALMVREMMGPEAAQIAKLLWAGSAVSAHAGPAS